MNLSDEVRRLSRELNISLSEIARRTGQSPANLSKKLNKETLSYEDFERILEVLGVQLTCTFRLPGQEEPVPAETDPHIRSRINILEKELELERLKNDYYRSSGFLLRTAMETISGSITLLNHHSGDPERVENCADRLQTALDQLMSIAGEDRISPRNARLRAADASLIGKRVLVVDDNAINRGIVTDLLADSGLEADEAESGEAAVERLTAAPEGRYDLVLMDLRMPDVDGFEAARRIRRIDGPRGRVPVVAMTAGDSPEDREEAKAAGMDGFVRKPLNLQKLFDLLSERKM